MLVLDNISAGQTPAMGQYVEFQIEIGGRFDIVIPFLMNPDSGIFDVGRDGNPITQGIDTYSAFPNTYAEATVSGVEFSPGVHKLSFTVTGQNLSSSGFVLRLVNALRFYPVVAD
jgi:hypothetical protein